MIRFWMLSRAPLLSNQKVTLRWAGVVGDGNPEERSGLTTWIVFTAMRPGESYT